MELLNSFEIVVFTSCFIGLVIGSMTDIKTREVPDFLNFLLIAAGFGFAAIAALVYSDVAYILRAVFGFILCFIFSYLMYHSGQWGGGDAKLLMGMGALLGLSYSEIMTFFLSPSLSSLPFLLLFLVLIFAVGGFYGTVWMFVLLSQHWKECKHFYGDFLHKQKYIRYVLLAVVSVLFISAFFISDILLQLLAVISGFFILVFYYGYILVVVVERVAMIRKIPVAQLTEGDWLAEPVVLQKKIVIPKSTVGVTRGELEKIKMLNKQKKIETVTVKYGIPFVPSFLIAFVISLAILLL